MHQQGQKKIIFFPRKLCIFWLEETLIGSTESHIYFSLSLGHEIQGPYVGFEVDKGPEAARKVLYACI